MGAMKKIKIIMALVTVASLIITVVLWNAMNHVDVDYEEVTVTVVSAEKVTHNIRVKGVTNTRFNENAVSVLYQGEIYELKNCHDTYSYREGKSVTAYLANGKMYANIEGIKTSTPVAILYYVFLFATFGMALGFPIYLSKHRE